MVGTNTPGAGWDARYKLVAVILHCYLMVNAGGEGKVVTEVKVSRDAHHNMSPVAVGIAAHRSRVDSIVVDCFYMEIEYLLRCFAY